MSSHSSDIRMENYPELITIDDPYGHLTARICVPTTICFIKNFDDISINWEVVKKSTFERLEKTQEHK